MIQGAKREVSTSKIEARIIRYTIHWAFAFDGSGELLSGRGICFNYNLLMQSSCFWCSYVISMLLVHTVSLQTGGSLQKMLVCLPLHDKVCSQLMMKMYENPWSLMTAVWVHNYWAAEAAGHTNEATFLRSNNLDSFLQFSWIIPPDPILVFPIYRSI